ncbi:hypothetical protein [Hoeflea prorocentri]|uniref:DUF2155 domain-containing protein n=1 Tax=Hoeflea prorocentri TaxID=1922333 RepID=A0A9X3ZGH1_9HYPH|nr:hypothetical protein [Hoeflea prorocentri]MCY6380772.1 hypothetical protein [Hoeflea prorocentri]MDA5398572.1 hypothetical protein [Hoeflea prorocentri]
MALILLALCFVSISALAGYDKAKASPEPSAVEAQIVLDGNQAGFEAQTAGFPQGGNKDDACPCKKSADSLTFTCGVTLALSGDDPGTYLFDTQQVWFVFGQADPNMDMTYRLKRPPRTHL